MFAAVFVFSCVGRQAPKPKVFDLVWRPRKAQVLRYRLSVDLKIEHSQTNFDADYIQRIRNLQAKGSFDVESTTKNFRVMTPEETETLPEEPPILEHFDARGRRMAVPAEDDPFGEIMDATTVFLPPDAPVKVGDKWSRKTPKAKMDYRLIGLDRMSGIPILHVRFAYAATGTVRPVKSTGYFLIDARDFSLFAAEASVENAKVTPDAEPGTVNVRLRRAS